MIEVHLYPKDIKRTYCFHTKQFALRFMYAMKSRGYIILDWTCDDPEDNEWLNRRFKL